MRAYQAALLTTEEQKLKYLCNAVVNSALDLEALKSDRSKILFSLLDRLTLSHIKLLNFFNNPNRLIREKAVFQGINISSLSYSLLSVFPVFNENKEMLNILCNDLESYGLTPNIDLHHTTGSKEVMQSRTTLLGKELLELITAYENKKEEGGL